MTVRSLRTSIAMLAVQLVAAVSAGVVIHSRASRRMVAEMPV
jgi:hypothetical protein